MVAALLFNCGVLVVRRRAELVEEGLIGGPPAPAPAAVGDAVTAFVEQRGKFHRGGIRDGIREYKGRGGEGRGGKGSRVRNGDYASHCC